MKRVWALCACGAALAAAAPGARAAAQCPVQPTFDPAVPTWEAVTGFAQGSRAATNEEIGAYLAAVDRASPRVVTAVSGSSLQGRPITHAIVSTPEQLAKPRLAALSTALRRVRRAGAGYELAARTVRRGPAVVWLAGGVHGDEPSGSDADLRVLYELAARTDCANDARLRRLITVIVPVQNPDGRAADTRVNAAGFDLNRDWFAHTQPETAATLALMRRFPPVLLADQHEEAGSSFFFPPYSDPIHHEITRESLAAMNDIAAPALRAAFSARGVGHASGGPYDLFFVGYGDSASTTQFGAGGMTFEKGRLAPFADKVAEHALAAGALLDAAATSQRRLVSSWVEQWRAAARQGARGRLEPNAALRAGDAVAFAVPSGRVHAYALRADRHFADAAALVARLQSAGVSVRRLRSRWRAARLDPYGERPAGPATLPAGTFIVRMAQGAKHWVQALLGEQPYAPFPYFYDVSAWSNPLLMGVDGGTLRTRVPARVLRPVTAAELAGGPPPRAGAAAYGWDGDSEGALGLATALLARGAPIARVPATGAFVAGGSVDRPLLTATAASRRVPVRALAAPPAGSVGLRAPRVALLGAPPGASGSWARFVVERRLGLVADVLGVAEIAGGRLAAGGYTALIVPDDPGAAAALDASALVALQAWVRDGGTYIGVRGPGAAVAAAAALTSARSTPPSPGLRIPGALLRVALDTSDPLGWGMGPAAFVFNNGDPQLTAGGARPVARYPDAPGFFVSGYADGAGALHATPAIVRERLGAGNVVVFAFDPAFRGYAEGTQRLLANALLMPAGGGSAVRGVPRQVSTPLLATVQPASRDSVVEVAPAHRQLLLDAAVAAGVPSTRRVERDPDGARLVVANPRAFDPGESGWPRRLLSALAARGVRPLYAAF